MYLRNNLKEKQKSQLQKCNTELNTDFELALIKIMAKEPDELFDNVQTDFYDRLHELSKEELIQLKELFIKNEWFQYLPQIEKHINDKI